MGGSVRGHYAGKIVVWPEKCGTAAFRVCPALGVRPQSPDLLGRRRRFRSLGRSKAVSLPHSKSVARSAGLVGSFIPDPGVCSLCSLHPRLYAAVRSAHSHAEQDWGQGCHLRFFAAPVEVRELFSSRLRSNNGIVWPDSNSPCCPVILLNVFQKSPPTLGE